jgi:hypothetical protein
MIVTKIPEPGQNHYYIQHKGYKAIIRALNGHDLEFAAYQNLSTISGINKIYMRLLIKENTPLLELDLEDYKEILFAVNKKVLKFIILPKNWLEIIYILGGRSFNPNWRQWLETPIEDLLAMLEVCKELESPRL